MRERRRALDISQQALADRAGVSRQTLFRIERDPDYDVSKRLCMTLAEILEAEESWLFYGERAS